MVYKHAISTVVPARNVRVGPGGGHVQPAGNDENGDSGEEEGGDEARSEENTSELQSLMRISYAVFCLKKTNNYSAGMLDDCSVLHKLLTVLNVQQHNYT